MNVTVVADADGQFPDYKGVKHGLVDRIGALHGGMVSGEASVVLGVKMDDGSLALVEVSMRHFFYAVKMFEANYTPQERGGVI